MKQIVEASAEISRSHYRIPLTTLLPEGHFLFDLHIGQDPALIVKQLPLSSDGKKRYLGYLETSVEGRILHRILAAHCSGDDGDMEDFVGDVQRFTSDRSYEDLVELHANAAGWGKSFQEFMASGRPQKQAEALAQKVNADKAANARREVLGHTEVAFVDTRDYQHFPTGWLQKQLDSPIHKQRVVVDIATGTVLSHDFPDKQLSVGEFGFEGNRWRTEVILTNSHGDEITRAYSGQDASNIRVRRGYEPHFLPTELESSALTQVSDKPYIPQNVIIPAMVWEVDEAGETTLIPYPQWDIPSGIVDDATALDPTSGLSILKGYNPNTSSYPSEGGFGHDHRKQTIRALQGQVLLWMQREKIGHDTQGFFQAVHSLMQ